jgi:hypothetical protein
MNGFLSFKTVLTLGNFEETQRRVPLWADQMSKVFLPDRIYNRSSKSSGKKLQ